MDFASPEKVPGFVRAGVRNPRSEVMCLRVDLLGLRNRGFDFESGSRVRDVVGRWLRRSVAPMLPDFSIFLPPRQRTGRLWQTRRNFAGSIGVVGSVRMGLGISGFDIM